MLVGKKKIEQEEVGDQDVRRFTPYRNRESMTPCSEESGRAPPQQLPNGSKGMKQPL